MVTLVQRFLQPQQCTKLSSKVGCHSLNGASLWLKVKGNYESFSVSASLVGVQSRDVRSKFKPFTSRGPEVNFGFINQGQDYSYIEVIPSFRVYTFGASPFPVHGCRSEARHFLSLFLIPVPCGQTQDCTEVRNLCMSPFSHANPMKNLVPPFLSAAYRIREAERAAVLSRENDNGHMDENCSDA